MKKKNKYPDYSLTHVLYQKLGNNWYAFTEVDGDCFMTRVDPSVVKAYRSAENEDSEGLNSKQKNSKAA